jgi:hypothetical protein
MNEFTKQIFLIILRESYDESIAQSEEDYWAAVDTAINDSVEIVKRFEQIVGKDTRIENG